MLPKMLALAPRLLQGKNPASPSLYPTEKACPSLCHIQCSPPQASTGGVGHSFPDAETQKRTKTQPLGATRTKLSLRQSLQEARMGVLQTLMWVRMACPHSTNSVPAQDSGFLYSFSSVLKLDRRPVWGHTVAVPSLLMNKAER